MILFQIVFSLFNLLLNTILQRILKNHTPYYIVAFCFLFFLNEIHSQELVLKIEASLAKNNPILHQIDYQKRHQDSTTLSLEIHRVEQHLKMMGYYSIRIQETITQQDTTIAKYSLGDKIETISIATNPSHLEFLQKFNLEKGILKIPSEKLTTTLEEISNQLEQKGYSFAEVSLYNTKIKEGILFADLQILPASKRSIQKLVVKGYDKLLYQTFSENRCTNPISKSHPSGGFQKNSSTPICDRNKTGSYLIQKRFYPPIPLPKKETK